MAQQVLVRQLDDINGQPADETLEFVWNGASLVIDLTTENAKRFREAISEFVDHARRNKKGTRGSAQRRQSGGRSEAALIREWATKQGYLVAPKGRIPADIVDRYHDRLV